MYTKTTEKTAEPPMVKYFQYLILFTITLFSLVIVYQTNNKLVLEKSLENTLENTIGEFYLSTLNSFNYFKNNKKNIQKYNVDNNIAFYSLENDEEVHFSEMTKSEIYKYQEELKKELENYKNGDIVSVEYINLQKSLEDSQYILDNEEYKYPYSQIDLDTIAYAIYREAGSSWLSNRHRDLVGCVVKNRKEQGGINQNLINPTYADILDEEGQYPYKSSSINPEVIPDYCYESAIRVLENKVNCPSSIVWQATFKQGSGVYEKFYDNILGTTTFFCER